MPDKLKQLYDALSADSNYKGIGSTYDEFSSAMQDSVTGKRVYDA